MSFSVATQLAPVETPKVKPKQQSIQPYAPQVTPGKAVLVKSDRQTANTDLLTFRRGTTTQKVIRDLSAVSPDISATIAFNLRMALSAGYKIKARDLDGTFNVDATRLAYSLATRFDMVPDYSTGFSQINSLLSTAEALGKEGQIEGAMCLELVLDKSRLPAKLVPLSASQIFFFEDDKGLRPIQRIAGVDIDLDVPTFFWVSLDQNLLSAYASSPLESGVQPVLADVEFTNDLRRVIKRAALPRMQLVVDAEEIAKVMPPEIKADPATYKTFLDTTILEIENFVNGLEPEDALVLMSYIEASYVDGGTGKVPEVFDTLRDIMNSKMSTGLKAMPSTLGHGSGSQNIASSETLLAMKTANGMIRLKINELFSKAFTLGVRLFGLDVAVAFELDEIDLRPAGELEAFRAMRQARLLELLSLGLLTDEEACIDLTGRLPPDGYVPRTGTDFFNATGATAGDNPYSGTSNGGAGGGAMNQSLKPTTPTKTKGKAK